MTLSEDWLERWQVGRIGWHEEGGNSSLQTHWAATGKRVLVPLCGKSRDLLWLEAQGNEVVGIEISEIAVMAFFEENGLNCEVLQGDLTAYVATDKQIRIYCGDYFAYSGGPFDGYYDRGALVAVAPDMRKKYVQHTRSLLAPDAASLVVTVEYDQAIANGPPFSIPTMTMQELWPELERVAARDDTENCPPKFREAGLREIFEAVWQRAPAPAG